MFVRPFFLNCALVATILLEVAPRGGRWTLVQGGADRGAEKIPGPKGPRFKVLGSGPYFPRTAGRADSTVGPDNAQLILGVTTTTTPIDPVPHQRSDLRGDRRTVAYPPRQRGVAGRANLMIILARKGSDHVRYRRASVFGLLGADRSPALCNVGGSWPFVLQGGPGFGHAPNYAISFLSELTAWIYFTAVIFF